MRKLVTALMASFFALFATAGQAVTVTFDDEPNGPAFGALDTSQGYTFDTSVLPGAGIAFIETRDVPNGNYYEIVVPGLVMRASDDSLFNLHELDVLFVDVDAPELGLGGTGSPNDVVIRAIDDSGDLIAELVSPYTDGLGWRTLTFGSEWTGIAELELGYSATAVESTYGGYDNIVVTAVPVPAAIWLFGTALIGLAGFSKRNKQLNLQSDLK